MRDQLTGTRKEIRRRQPKPYSSLKKTFLHNIILEEKGQNAKLQSGKQCFYPWQLLERGLLTGAIQRWNSPVLAVINDRLYESSHLSLNVLTIQWPLQYKSYLKIRLILGFMKDITDFFFLWNTIKIVTSTLICY